LDKGDNLSLSAQADTQHASFKLNFTAAETIKGMRLSQNIFLVNE
jgi:hypothetical protein